MKKRSGEQTFEGRRENLSHANKLSRTYAVLLDTLNRHRGKGMQKITVEHVHVHSGGQAVPGMGIEPKSEDQTHGSRTTAKASRLASRPVAQPAMRSPKAEREPVPVTINAEGNVAGRSKG